MPSMSGRKYMEWGASLMLFKYGLDSFVATYLFHHQWSFWNYFVPGTLSGVLLTSSDAWFYSGMLMCALPFAFLGSIFTLRRLNTLCLPPWMVILFFIPFVNMLFFIILAVAKSPPSTLPAVETLEVAETEETSPTQLEYAKSTSHEQLLSPEEIKAAKEQHQLALSRELEKKQSTGIPGEKFLLSLISLMPVDSPRAFLVAALLPVPISVLAAMFSVTILGVYGWSIFTVVPFVAAIATPVLYGWNKRRTLVECLLSSVTCLMLMASTLLILPIEGIICLAMATPLAIGVGLVGGLTGYAIQASLPRNEGVPRMLSCFALFIPLLMVGEFFSPVPFPTYENVSTIDIAAPPHVVWKYLIDFPRLKEPTELIFKTGIAYPIEAKISGRGPGAIRECIFTTGKFVEPIEIWDEPKLLRFGVLEQAPPMHEMSLYPKLHPPHLDHYLLAKQGQFRLKANGANQTKLYGSTWYENRMGPGAYWRLWSDWIIHSIHMRVLNHVKTLSENEWRNR